MHLAALHWNENADRVATGNYKVVFAKARKGKATLREVKQNCTYSKSTVFNCIHEILPNGNILFKMFLFFLCQIT